jgi:phenylalanyl-tRNA synthetase beta chain
MNVSYRWLQAMLPELDVEPAELAERMALRGAPVDAIDSPGEGLGDVVVAKVLSAERHPNADRLSLCKVDGGAGVVQVVCGAPNVTAGSWYPFAPVGAVLPGDFKIKKAKIRGETSEGMLCSARELGLGTDHSGILEIHGDLTPGQRFVEALGLDDVTLDVEVTANRGDLLSHLGVARELASAEGAAPVLPPIPGDPCVTFDYVESTGEVAAGGVRVRIDDAALCPRYLGAVLRGISVGPSPAWLQERLRGAGARPINNVVDSTNYVMLELGQPLHAFDLARLAGSSVVVRQARPDESPFTTLDDVARALAAGALMICDAERPVAVAGVMGGQDSEVRAETTDVLLECALFDPPSIRSTRRALGLSTDASYRFERGVDPEGMRRAVERCVALILTTAGGRLDGPVLDCRPRAFEAEVLTLRLSRIEHLLGVPFTAERVRELLTPLGFEILGEEERKGSAVLRVRVPGFRSYDVRREVDLIEEIARTHGYDAFPDTLGPYRPGTVPDHPLFQLEDELRRMLAARGLFEAHTPAFVPAGEGDVEVANPLTTTEPFVRRALLPSLVRRVEHNFSRGNRDVRLFEIGTSFRKAGPGERPNEETHVAGVLTGRTRPPHWSRADEPLDVWDLKGLLEEVARVVCRGGSAVSPVAGSAGAAAGTGAAGGSGRSGGPAGRGASASGEPAAVSDWLDPRAAFVVSGPGGERVGFGGRLRADRLDAPVWAGDVWAFELTLPRDVEPRTAPTYVPVPTFPGVERDLALVVPARVTAADVTAAIRVAAGPLLESVDVFDRYVGPGIAAGARSLAFRLRFRAPERTLKDHEADRAVRQVLERLEEDLGVEARG